ncbi:hypothetical protein ACFX13_030414 [Malus domestica]
MLKLALWCKHCQALKLRDGSYQAQGRRCNFAKVDATEKNEVSHEYNIKSMIGEKLRSFQRLIPNKEIKINHHANIVLRYPVGLEGGFGRVDLQLRSNRGCQANDHGFEEHGKGEHGDEVEAGGADDGYIDLDRKRKWRLNEQLGSSQQLVIAIAVPPISTTNAEVEDFNGGSSHRLHHHH